MALNAKTASGSGGTSIPPLEAGVYPGQLLSVIDLGLQAQQPYKGQEKPPVHKIMLTYELADEFLDGEDGQPDEEKPRVVSESIPLYNLEAEKAKSTQRYKVLDPQLEADGDFTALLGTPINISIVQSPGKNGKVYNNIAGIAPMRPKEAAKIGKAVNPSFAFDLDAPDKETWELVHDWVRKIIVANLEFKGSKLDVMLGDEYVADTSEASVEAEEADEESPY